jgi:hypothetical protein
MKGHSQNQQREEGPHLFFKDGTEDEENADDDSLGLLLLDVFDFDKGMNCSFSQGQLVAPVHISTVNYTNNEKEKEYIYNRKRKLNVINVAPAAELTDVFESEQFSPMLKQLRRLHESMQRSETTRKIILLQREAMARMRSNPQVPLNRYLWE